MPLAKQNTKILFFFVIGCFVIVKKLIQYILNHNRMRMSKLIKTLHGLWKGIWHTCIAFFIPVMLSEVNSLLVSFLFVWLFFQKDLLSDCFYPMLLSLWLQTSHSDSGGNTSAQVVSSSCSQRCATWFHLLTLK